MLLFYSIVAVDPISLWQLTQFRCGSWPNFVVAVDPFLLWQLARLSVLLIITESNMTMIIKRWCKIIKKRRERRGFFEKSGVFFEKSKVIFYIPIYYKPVTFSSFTLNSIKFYLITFAISDIFPNFASTFPTDEMNIKIRL